jgi:tRNA (guanine-N7-)-methyltransferase
MAGKNKLRRFSENETFDCLFQPSFEEIFRNDYKMKSKWRTDYFKNNNPIVIELGCGRGEYTVNMAKANPDVNYIGFDIKGARLWRGAKTAHEEELTNVAFVRTKIENINSFFAENEVDEIWITFPDPQPKKERKRLSGPMFLQYYKKFLKPEGVVHLKTDSRELYDFTNEVIKELELPLVESDSDIYNSEIIDRLEVLKIKTTYEKLFLKENKKITYTKYKIDNFVFENYSPKKLNV